MAEDLNSRADDHEWIKGVVARALLEVTNPSDNEASALSEIDTAGDDPTRIPQAAAVGESVKGLGHSPAVDSDVSLATLNNSAQSSVPMKTTCSRSGRSGCTSSTIFT